MGGNDPNNITLKKAVADTVQSGVVVYSIFVSGAPSAGNGTPMAGGGLGGGGVGAGIIPGLLIGGESESNGAMNLSELTAAAGGVSYAENGTPPRFTNFLDDMLQRLGRQIAT